MKKDNYKKGRIGEEAVCIYLDKIGNRIIERNYRNRFGEIDVIFVENKTLVFGEVKTRTNIDYGYPVEAVDMEKQRKIIGVAKQFITLNVKYLDELESIRFDVFEVYLRDKKIRQIKYAFMIS